MSERVSAVRESDLKEKEGTSNRSPLDSFLPSFLRRLANVTELISHRPINRAPRWRRRVPRFLFAAAAEHALIRSLSLSLSVAVLQFCMRDVCARSLACSLMFRR